MDVAVREYSGVPNYIKGAPSAPKRDGVKITHRQTVRAFEELGNRALNAYDFERTLHLPVGRGRLACDPETGEFDADAQRPAYNARLHSAYPMHLHSTITTGETITVLSVDEMNSAISTKKWSKTPIERRRRFTLTTEDEMMNLKAQVVEGRAHSQLLERKLEESMSGVSPNDAVEQNSILTAQLEQEKQARLDLEARFNRLLETLNAVPPSDVDPEVKKKK